MIRVDRRLFSHFDWILLAVAVAIAATGLMTLLSTTRVGGGGSLFLRQLIWLAAGFALFGGVISIDYRILIRYAPAIYAVAVSLLVLVLVAGRSVKGAQRWIGIGPLGVQPAEFFDLAFVLILAWYLADRRDLGRWGTLLVPVALWAVPFLLIIKQPDLGTGLVLVPVLVAMLFQAGVRPRNLAALGAVGLLVAPAAWFLLKDYQRARLLVYLDPTRDPLGTAYNLIQSKIAIGAGQTWGQGLFGGTQSKLAFLPERNTDFIFSVFAEEWGFVGALFLLILYFVLAMRGYEIADRARDGLGCLLATGATASIVSQSLINIGMVTGILPVVGLPLPLMSYGGSSMLATMATLGLLENVTMRRFGSR